MLKITYTSFSTNRLDKINAMIYIQYKSRSTHGYILWLTVNRYSKRYEHKID